MKKLTLSLAFYGLLLTSGSAVTVFDDFNDGNDTGWTRSSPLAGFGAGGVFTFPSGGYSISAPASPNPSALGPGRAASLRNDASQTQFEVYADLIDWDVTKPAMVMGVLARVSSFGLGTTTGYGLIYTNGTLQMIRITAEAGTTIATTPVSISITNDYRIRFTGDGANLAGELYDLAAPSVSIANVAFTDATYASGVPGVFVYDGSGGGATTATATFDNFSASVPEPSGLVTCLVGASLFFRSRRRSA
jgi:hypothetical protein